jgi:hypothetical protein
MKTLMSCFAAATLWLAVTPAAAAVQLDQSDIPLSGILSSGAGSALDPGFGLGQTFTAGLSGQLMWIDLAIIGSPFSQASGGFNVSLEKTPGVSLGSSHVSLPQPYTNDFAQLPRIDFSALGVQIAANESYRIVLTVDAGTNGAAAGWFYQVGNTPLNYAGGSAFVATSFGDFAQPLDYGFRTYVETSVVAAPAPEPGAWVLLILGFAGTGTALRYRRKDRIVLAAA